MPLIILDNQLSFPSVTLADPDGLVAVGGDLSVERLLLAYRSGIFPWYEGEHILWWSPDPRFILVPEELQISKSMKQVIRKHSFSFTVDSAFTEVINSCKKTLRKDQDGTWITDDVRDAYIRLHQEGYAHSAEAWMNGELVGGLYGIRMGKIFFGESMFSTQSNASKFAFISYVELLREDGVTLIDCQVYTEHLESLGAKMIPRAEFIKWLDQNLVPR